MTSPPAAKPRFADLGVRVASALVLVSIAALDFWMGGTYVIVLVLIGVVLMLWEYRRLFTGKPLRLTDNTLLVMAGGGALAVIATGMHSYLAGCLVGLGAAAAAAVTDRPRAVWMGTGAAYIILGMAVLVAIRGDEARGIPVVLWLVCVVIATDVGGYFAGKLIGGPKFWPRISPNKTWAGMVGGLVLAMLVGAAFYLSGHVALPVVILLSAFLAVCSQAGDLLESWLKRRQGVKDSSSLIPGHGGLMDRFDGLLGALWAYVALDLSGALG